MTLTSPRRGLPLISLRAMSTTSSHPPPPIINPLTHVSEDSRLPTMVDVSTKAVTTRTAVAESRIKVPPTIVALFEPRSQDVATPKGPVFATAIVAGTLGAKRTSELIPFCHPLPIDSVKFSILLEQDTSEIVITCTVRVSHKTGVEMEALTGASIAALTVYDMCKAVSHDLIISDTRLLSKTGGKSDFGSLSKATNT